MVLRRYFSTTSTQGGMVLGISSLALALGAGLIPPPQEANAAESAARRYSLTRTDGRPFRPASPFNQPIGKNVQVDPNSAAMVRVLAGRGYATAQVYADTPPIYNAGSRTGRYAIQCTENWGTCDLERMRNPIPDRARPSHGHDANMVVVDHANRRVHEFWKYRNDKGTTAWGAVLPLGGSGTGRVGSDPGRYGATGSGISRLAGVIRTFEVRRGWIGHALVGPTGFSCKGTYRYPAVKSDGWSTASNCIPEGARVQLRRGVKCKTLPGITSWELMVCRALKRYGWYNIDNGNVGVPGFGIQFENPAGERDPYPAIGLKDYSAIRHIPLRKLRVLKRWNSYD